MPENCTQINPSPPVSITACTMTLLDELFAPFLWENRDKRFDKFPMMSSPLWAAGKTRHEMWHYCYDTNLTLIVVFCRVWRYLFLCLHICFLFRTFEPRYVLYVWSKDRLVKDIIYHCVIICFQVWPRNTITNYLRPMTIMVDGFLVTFCLALAVAIAIGNPWQETTSGNEYFNLLSGFKQVNVLNIRWWTSQRRHLVHTITILFIVPISTVCLLHFVTCAFHNHFCFHHSRQ